jgi:hypothetical protein
MHPLALHQAVELAVMEEAVVVEEAVVADTPLLDHPPALQEVVVEEDPAMFSVDSLKFQLLPQEIP